MILEFGTKIWIQASFQGLSGTPEYLDIVSHCLNPTRTLSLDIECPPNFLGQLWVGAERFVGDGRGFSELLIAERGECNV
jgi:hypothetical protein